MLLVGVCRWGFRLLAGDLYIYMHSVGVDVCISCVGFMLYGWVHVGVYLCCVWGDILALGVCSGNLTVCFDNE